MIRSIPLFGGRWAPAPATRFSVSPIRSPQRSGVMKRARALALLVVLAAAAGCGGTATVNGKVTYQGRPVLSGSVIVLNADGTARSGVILRDGTYAVEGV